MESYTKAPAKNILQLKGVIQMKKLLAIVIFLASVNVSMANSGYLQSAVVTDIKQHSRVIPDRRVTPGGRLVTTTTFTFLFNSCRKFEKGKFLVNVDEKKVSFEEKNGEVSEKTQNFVTIKLNNKVADCYGPSFTREYTLKTYKLSTNKDYILANPSKFSKVLNN